MLALIWCQSSKLIQGYKYLIPYYVPCTTLGIGKQDRQVLSSRKTDSLDETNRQHTINTNKKLDKWHVKKLKYSDVIESDWTVTLDWVI